MLLKALNHNYLLSNTHLSIKVCSRLSVFTRIY